MTDVFEPSQETFDEIYEAVAETKRGRWFLSEISKRNRAADTEQVLLGLEQLKSAFASRDEVSSLDILRHELEQMSDSINQTREEISSIKPNEDTNNRIMAATEELDAIVTSTERATSEILGIAERLQEVADKMRQEAHEHETWDEIEGMATQIFMACSFQDITGQRITKVVNVMRYLEQRVNAMIEIWGATKREGGGNNIVASNEGGDAHLLNGPQSQDKAISQDHIDLMLDAEDIDEAAAEVAREFDQSPAIDEIATASSHDTPTESASAESAPESTDEDMGGEEVSQDDIDAMFG